MTAAHVTATGMPAAPPSIYGGFWRRSVAMLIKEFIQLRRDRIAVVLHQPARGEHMSGFCDASRKRVARCVAGGVARVGDRQDRDTDGNESAGFVNGHR